MRSPRLAAFAVALACAGWPAAMAVASGPPPGDAETLREAELLLLEVSRAYSEAPALTDEMKTVIATAGNVEMDSTVQVRIDGKNAEATGITGALDMRAVDGSFYMQVDGMDGAVKRPLGDDPVASSAKAMGPGAAYLPPQLGLRWAKDAAGLATWCTYGMLENPVLAGHAMIAVDGTDVKRHEVLFQGSNVLANGEPSTCRIQIDPATHLIAKIVAEIPRDDIDGNSTITMTCAPKVLAQLPAPIVVDLGDADTFEDFDAMMMAGMGDFNPSIEVGSMAPEFELVDQNGETHSSVAYRGKIMMLDWWGVW